MNETRQRGAAMANDGDHDWREYGVAGRSYCPKCGAIWIPVGHIVPSRNATTGQELPLCEVLHDRRVIDGVIVTDYRRAIPPAGRGDA